MIKERRSGPTFARVKRNIFSLQIDIQYTFILLTEIHCNEVVKDKMIKREAAANFATLLPELRGRPSKLAYLSAFGRNIFLFW